MTDQTARLLAEIPALAAQLRPFLIPSNNPGSDGPRPAPTSRPPLNVDLLDLIAGRALDMWVQLTIDELPEDQPIPENVPSSRTRDIFDMCRWLTSRLPWIIGLHHDFPTEVQKLHAAYCRAAGIPVHKPWPCPDCKWNLEPKGDSDADGQAILHVCHGCGRVWRLKELQDRLQHLEEQTGWNPENAVTLAYAAKAIGRPVSTLHEWVQTGQLVALGFDQQRNSRLFDLTRIQEMSEARRQHEKKRRFKAAS